MRWLLLVLWPLVIGGLILFFVQENRRQEFLASVGAAKESTNDCPGELDDAAVAAVKVYWDMRNAVQSGALKRARQDARALERHYIEINPDFSAAAGRLASSDTIEAARAHLKTLDEMLENPKPPRTAREPRVSVP